MDSFAGKTAVITGAGSGIGAAMADYAVAQGMKLVLADVDREGLERVRAGLATDDVLVQPTDVTDPAAVAALADAAWDRFGQVDLLCANAGIVPGGRHRPVWEYEPADWRWAFGVNVDGVTNCIRSFVPRLLRESRPAHVQITGSVAGFVSGAGSACYGASKHAVVRVAEALYAGLRDEQAPIGVTLLAPGLVATRIYDSERSRPAHLQASAGPAAEAPELQSIADQLYAHALTPAEAARITFEGIRENRFYVFTSDRFDGAIRRRTEAILARSNPEFESLLALTKGDVGMTENAS
ncbi:SDR family NAD(P)-dependent oxidoreductase [Novosphingobium rosa]|uniref:SDR family NAD(P)-dependent oxidoreductase n=1 Tax=Novosphingobium rosa TaxID=76978 RepID=UPI000836D713|nr:SDR family NAD(P)-dependent oxidoreductase [Novosphingobium rosa]